jgi:SAM-dependent methyltransferase
MMREFISKMVSTVQDIPYIRGWSRGGVNYWKWRVHKYGVHSVLNLGHNELEFDKVTQEQKHQIYPWFLNQLSGRERSVLDFGCGPGRFTGDLAAMIHGNAIGVDPISELLFQAPRSPNVEYKSMIEDVIPLSDSSVDVIWVCLVLGGIQGRGLTATAREIDRVLKSEGLLFLVENTSSKKDGPYWKFRQVTEYVRMFPNVRLVHLHDYDDLGERISIMAGRK